MTKLTGRCWEARHTWRVPVPTAMQRRAQLQRCADAHGRPVSSVRWQTAHWSIFITNAPPHLLSLPHAQVLAKVRWQIGLLFKRWKSAGLLDECRSAAPWRCLTEGFAKLLALLIQHWCYLRGVWHLPERSLHLAAAFPHLPYLPLALSVIQPALATCKMSAVRKRPPTSPLILRGSVA